MKETCTWLAYLSTACHKQPKEKNTCMGIRNEYKNLSKINHFKEKQKIFRNHPVRGKQNKHIAGNNYSTHKKNR